MELVNDVNVPVKIVSSKFWGKFVTSASVNACFRYPTHILYYVIYFSLSEVFSEFLQRLTIR